MGTELDIDDVAADHPLAKAELQKLRDERERLLTLATKHCPRGHHDWQEILRIAADT